MIYPKRRKTEKMASILNCIICKRWKAQFFKLNKAFQNIVKQYKSGILLL